MRAFRSRLSTFAAYYGLSDSLLYTAESTTSGSATGAQRL